MEKLLPEAVDHWLKREAEGSLSYGESKVIDNLREKGLFPSSQEGAQQGAGFMPRMKASFSSTKDGEQSVYQKSYPGAQFTRNQSGELQMQPQSGQPYLPVNKPGLDVGDIGAMAGSVPEIAGSMIGGTWGMGAGALAGGAAGAGAGGATANAPGAVGGGAGGVITGGLIGSAIGSGMGGAAGELAKKAIGRSVIGVDEPGISMSDMGDAARVGAMNALLPLGAAAAGRGLKAAMHAIPNSVASKVTAEGRRALDFIKDVPRRFGMQDMGEVLQPAQVTESRVADVLHNIAAGSLAGQRMVQFTKKTDQQLNKIVDAIQGTTPLNPDEVGEMLAQSILRRREHASAISSKLYERIREAADPTEKMVTKAIEIPSTIVDANGRPLTTTILKTVKGREGGAQFDVAPIVKLAEQLTERGNAIGNVEAETMGFNLAERLAKVIESPSFSELQSLRTGLRSYVRRMEQTDKKTPGIGFAKKASSTINNVLREGLEKFDPKVLAELDGADAKYAKVSEMLYNKLTQRIIQRAEVISQPEQIFGLLFKPGAINPAKSAMSLADAPTKDALERLAVQTIIKRSMKDGQVVGQQLDNVMFGKAGIGDQTLNAWIRPAVKDNLSELANVLKLHQDKQGSGIGAMWVQLMQGRGLSGIIGSVLTLGTFGGTAAVGTGALTVAAPAVLSRMLTNPKTIKLFIEGAKMPPAQFGRSAVATRLIAAGIDAAHDLREDMDSMSGEKKGGVASSPNQKRAAGIGMRPPMLPLNVPMVPLPVKTALTATPK